MTVIKHIIGLICLIVWGYAIYDMFEYGTHNCLVLYTIGVTLHCFFVVMLSYSVYHHRTHHRSFCWQCLSGEHDTCRRSDEARIKSLLYKHH